MDEVFVIFEKDRVIKNGLNFLVAVENLPRHCYIPVKDILDWYSKEYAIQRTDLCGTYLPKIKYNGTIEGWKHTAESELADIKKHDAFETKKP